MGSELWVEAYCSPLDRAELMAVVGLPASVAAAVVDAAEGSARDAIKIARRVRDRVDLAEGPYAPEAKRLLAAVERHPAAVRGRVGGLDHHRVGPPQPSRPHRAE